MTPTRSHGEAEAESPAGRLLYRGAEADLLRGKWQGLDAVFKVRTPLAYRLAALDAAIRRQRTLREAQMMSSAKAAGLLSPRLFFVDVARSVLVMEYVLGRRLKELIPSGSAEDVAALFDLLGHEIARMHMAGIMHGDLTTANLVKRYGKLVFLDFGLSLHSARLEDHAVDLRLMKETLVGAHSEISSLALESLTRGYSAESGANRAKAVMNQLRAIERRGRYARLG